jgi:hypothetical protein
MRDRRGIPDRLTRARPVVAARRLTDHRRHLKASPQLVEELSRRRHAKVRQRRQSDRLDTRSEERDRAAEHLSQLLRVFLQRGHVGVGAAVRQAEHVAAVPADTEDPRTAHVDG